MIAVDRFRKLHPTPKPDRSTRHQLSDRVQAHNQPRAGTRRGSQRSVFEIVVVIEGRAGARRLRRRRTLQELWRVALARLARFARRALGRIAADLRLQLYDVEEDVGLP